MEMGWELNKSTVKPVLSSHSKKDQKISFQDRLWLNAGQKYCSLGAFCNTFDLHQATICLKNLCYPPTKSEGYSFGVVRASVRLSVRPFRPSFRPSALFVCPEPYLSTYWSDLIHSWYK